MMMVAAGGVVVWYCGSRKVAAFNVAFSLIPPFVPFGTFSVCG